MTRHNPIKAGYDLLLWEKYGIKIPITVDVSRNLHWLICGNSGSGKSYLALILIRNLVTEYRKDIVLTVIDFKNSDDYLFLKEYSRYYTGEESAKGLERFYEEYLKIKEGKIADNCLRILIFDEWAGFQIWETHQNKKQAEKYKSYLLEILLLGRSMLCGAWVIMQRNDAKYIEGRDQMFVTIALGKMSREMKQMIMQGEDLEQRDVYTCGEGIIRTDSGGTKFIKVPKLRDINKVRQQIVDILAQANTAEGGVGESSETV